MLIEYNVTIDDLVAFSLFHNKHSATVRRMNIIWGVVLPAGFFIFFCFLGLYKHEWGSPLFGLIAGGLLILWILAGRRKRLEKIVRKLLSEGSNNKSIGKHKLELTDTGLVEKSEYEETKIVWEALDRIGFTTDYTFIFTGPARGILIPHAHVLEGDYEGFISQLRQTFEDKLRANNVLDISQRIIVSPNEIYKRDLGSGLHSGLGIASFIIFIITVVLYFLIFGVSTVFAVVAPELADRQSPVMRVTGALLLLGILANIIGLALGITGVTRKNRKKLLSILGLIFNSIILIVFFALVVIANVIH